MVHVNHVLVKLEQIDSWRSQHRTLLKFVQLYGLVTSVVKLHLELDLVLQLG